MRTFIAALLAALTLSALVAPAAPAAPTEVDVRIEGRTETLFEGPVLTDGHNVRAAESDSKAPASGRTCDGTNGGSNPTPGPTPTAASVDAMSILGESFDGQWYPGYDDYFVKRWGPDAEDEGHGEYWGLLVNDVFTSVGGCQYRLDAGDEVLWVYDAFGGRPTLALFPEEAAYVSGPRPLTAIAQLGVPLPVEVVSYEDDVESVPQPAPGRSGSVPYEGAQVAPVLTGAEGFEKAMTADPATETTDSQGKAGISFSTAGWHRIKATVTAAGGGESVVRSNRLDVCVPAAGSPPPPAESPLEGASDCSELPAADQVREGDAELPADDETGEERSGGAGSASASAAPNANGPSSPDARIRVTVPRLDRDDVARGRVGVSWRVLSRGVGIGGWRISSRRLGRRGAPYVSRATGTDRTSALLRLPPGAAYRLRFSIVDLLGRGSTVALGKVVVPAAGVPGGR